MDDKNAREILMQKFLPHFCYNLFNSHSYFGCQLTDTNLVLTSPKQLPVPVR